MADIVQEFPIKAAPSRVYWAVTTPAGLDQWWTARSKGDPRLGAEYELWFGPKYDWRAKVTRCRPDLEFELEMTQADHEWIGTRVGFELKPLAGGKETLVKFYHRAWPAETENWRVSCYCWAMYLRILRRHLEHGESVPYERRLEV